MIGVDDRYWPIVVFRFAGELSLAELDDYLAKMELLLDRPGRSGGLVLHEKVRAWDSAMVRRQAAWMKANADRIREKSLGVALVVTSPLLRGLLRAILWIQPMPQAHRVFADIPSALAWLSERLASGGLRMPDVEAHL
jgi:hypothetical protein